MDSYNNGTTPPNYSLHDVWEALLNIDCSLRHLLLKISTSDLDVHHQDGDTVLHLLLTNWGEFLEMVQEFWGKLQDRCNNNEDVEGDRDVVLRAGACSCQNNLNYSYGCHPAKKAGWEGKMIEHNTRLYVQCDDYFSEQACLGIDTMTKTCVMDDIIDVCTDGALVQVNDIMCSGDIHYCRNSRQNDKCTVQCAACHNCIQCKTQTNHSQEMGICKCDNCDTTKLQDHLASVIDRWGSQHVKKPNHCPLHCLHQPGVHSRRTCSSQTLQQRSIICPNSQGCLSGKAHESLANDHSVDNLQLATNHHCSLCRPSAAHLSTLAEIQTLLSRDILATLTSHQSLVNSQNASGDTPLHIALGAILSLGEHRFDSQHLRLLVTSTNVNLQNVYGETALHLALAAMSGGHEFEAEDLLMLVTSENLEMQTTGGELPLHVAASGHQALPPGVLPALITPRALNTPDNGRRTPLAAAIEAGTTRPDVIARLMTENNVNFADNNNVLPLSRLLAAAAAASSSSSTLERYVDVVKLALSKGADCNQASAAIVDYVFSLLSSRPSHEDDHGSTRRDKGPSQKLTAENDNPGTSLSGELQWHQSGGDSVTLREPRLALLELVTSHSAGHVVFGCLLHVLTASSCYSCCEPATAAAAMRTLLRHAARDNTAATLHINVHFKAGQGSEVAAEVACSLGEARDQLFTRTFYQDQSLVRFLRMLTEVLRQMIVVQRPTVEEHQIVLDQLEHIQLEPHQLDEEERLEQNQMVEHQRGVFTGSTESKQELTQSLPPSTDVSPEPARAITSLFLDSDPAPKVLHLTLNCLEDLEQLANQPVSLQKWCVLAVRRSLQDRSDRGYRMLPLPATLTSLMTYDGLANQVTHFLVTGEAPVNSGQREHVNGGFG